jgi:broad specificity phosphatase PhoE
MDTGPSLWLIRHGETEWSKSGQHTSRTDLTLTDAGREQARRIAPLIAGVHFSAVVVSPRQRAQQTCELSGCHTVSGVAPVVDEDLAEWDYGEYEGITTAEIQKRVATWSLWTDGAPGGESPLAMSARVDRLIERWAVPGATVAMFGHGHVLRVLALRWLGWPLTYGAQLGLDTATVSELGMVGGKRGLAVWNRGA